MGGRPAAFRVGRTRRSRRVMRRCFTHYEGRTAANHPSGDKFDSSYDRGKPAKFAPNQVIRGWTEAMQMMVEGDKWELYIPPRCASIRVRTALAIHVHRTLLGWPMAPAGGRPRSLATRCSSSRSRSSASPATEELRAPQSSCDRRAGRRLASVAGGARASPPCPLPLAYTSGCRLWLYYLNLFRALKETECSYTVYFPPHGAPSNIRPQRAYAALQQRHPHCVYTVAVRNTTGDACAECAGCR